MNLLMLDTNICSYVMREHPASVLQQLVDRVKQGDRIVISAITYMEMRQGQIGKKAPAGLKRLIDAFVQRLDAVLPLDQRAIDAGIAVKARLVQAGHGIGANDTWIAGHALASGATLITNNLREFERVRGLDCENWV